MQKEFMPGKGVEDMATEPFLINPPKRLRRRSRRKNPVGETITIIGANPSRRNPMRRFKHNAWFGHSAAHRRAVMVRWGKKKRVSGKRKRAVVHRVRRRTVDRRTASYRAMRAAQFREAAGFLALTAPGKKRRFRYVGGKGWVRRKNNPRRSYMRRRRVRRNTWFGQPRRHRKAAFKGWRRGHKIGSRRVRHYRHNAPKHFGGRRRHRRSSYRSNPALSLGGVTRGLMDVRGWGPLAITGGVSAIAGGVVPGLLGLVNPWARLGAQLVTAIGGGALVSKFVDSRHGQAFMIVGVSMVGYQLLKQFVLIPYLPQFAVGLGNSYGESDYGDYTFDDVSQRVSAFPSEGVAAFPSEGVAGFGAYQESVGCYPYGDD